MSKERSDWFGRLSPKEREALETYAEVHSYEAVARVLGKSESAVDRQLLNARRKMGVSSTAEAMFMLAQYKLRLQDADPQRRNTREARSSALVAAAILAAGLLLALVFVTAQSLLGAPKSRFGDESLPATSLGSIDSLRSELEKLHEAGGLTEGRDADRRRAQLVVAVSDLAWKVMWGPDEDSFLNAISAIIPDIRAAYKWCKTHDPDAAVRIAGNAHRVFARLPALADWVTMLDEAVSIPGTTHGLYYGRALCGVAFAHWFDARARGLRSAREALRVFESIPYTDWDRANAIRYIGTCSAAADTRLALDCHRRALAIYRNLREPRGIAMTMLSLGEETPGLGTGADALKGMEWDIAAAQGFRRLQNANLENEAINEIEKIEILVPRTGRYTQWLAQARSQLRSSAEERASAHETTEAQRLDIHAMRLDAELRDYWAVTGDLEFLLRTAYVVACDAKTCERLKGYYRHLSRSLGRPIDGSLLDADGPSEAFGEKMTIDEVLNAAEHLAQRSRARF